MSKYWPSNFDIEDTSSPLDILRTASQEWHDHTGGLVCLAIQETESTNKNHLLIVHAQHVPSNRTVALFSVVHRLNTPYPVAIEPKNEQLPNFLKKSYYQHGLSGLSFPNITGEKLTNEWVSDTPSEFRSKLEKVFNLGTLKSDVLSLVSGSTAIEETQDPQSIKDASAKKRKN